MKLTPALFLAAAWACVALPTSVAQQTDIDDLREEILTAWAKRRESIKTLRVEATIERFVPGTKDQDVNGNPFGQVTSSEYLNTHLELAYSRAGEKRWVRLHTDENLVQAKPLILKPYTLIQGFDGEENRLLLDGGLTPIPSCQVEQSETPDSFLTDGTTLLPLLVWSELDEKLERGGWQPDRMTPESPAEVVDRTKLVRFNVPRNNGWTSTLELDPKHGWAPVRWKSQLNGQPRFSLKLQYDTSDPADPKIIGWKSERYFGEGKLESSEVAQVTKLEINKPVADKEFEVAFPAGVQVMTINEKGRKHIVLPRKDKPIPADEWQFGKSED